MRKYAFSMRVTNDWNDLGDNVVLSESVNGFKNSYDRSKKGIFNKSILTLDQTKVK